MNTFKIGQRVRIKKNVRAYSITVSGSEGIIIANPSKPHITIKFYKLGDNRSLCTFTNFIIRKQHLEIIDNSIKTFGIVKFCEKYYKK